MTHLLAFVCVALIATGQLLFKETAHSLSVAGTPWNVRVLGVAAAALTIYAVATVLWILLLRTAPLNRLYPYMALSFVLVTAASWLVFREPLSASHLLGIGLIVGGVAVVAVS